MNRNDVIKGLKLCTNFDYENPGNTCSQCPLGKLSDDANCQEMLMRDALIYMSDANLILQDQYRWERDIALEQLKSIGKSLGEKMDDIQALIKEAKHDVSNRD